MLPSNSTVNILLTVIMGCNCCFVGIFCTVSRAPSARQRRALARTLSRCREVPSREHEVPRG
jgi:hypothetical protein